MTMENISLMNSDEEDHISNDYSDEFQIESERNINHNNNKNFDDENSIENDEQLTTINKRRRINARKSNYPKKKSKKENSNITRTKNSKNIENPYNIDQNSPENLDKDNNDLIVPKKKKNRKSLNKNGTMIKKINEENITPSQTVKGTKRSKRAQSVKSKNKKLKKNSSKTIQRDGDENNIQYKKDPNFSEDSFLDHTEINLSNSFSKNKKSNRIYDRNKMIDNNYNHHHENQKNSDQLEIEILFDKNEDDKPNANIIKNPNYTEEISKGSFQNGENQIHRKLDSLPEKNNSIGNQGTHFKPRIDEFYYGYYSRPPILRIDTSLVAESENRPSLRLSDPYRVTNFSSKINDSESDNNNSENNFILRDLIIASGSEYDYSSHKIMNHSNLNSSKRISKVKKLNDSYDQEISSDNSELTIKKKDSHIKSNILPNKNNSQIKSHSQSSIDSNTNTNNTKKISIDKDKELVININISDKFNTTRNNNSADIETPKQFNSFQQFDSRGINSEDKKFLEFNNNSNSIMLLPNRSSSSEIDKKLNISPAINIQKDESNLNIINECPNINDVVIYRIEDQEPEDKPILQIQQTNSYDQNLLMKSTIGKNNIPKTYNNYSNNSTLGDNTINKYNINKDKNTDFKISTAYENKPNNQISKRQKYSDESRNKKRCESVPNHKSSHEGQRKDFKAENNNNNLYESKERSIITNKDHYQDYAFRGEGSIVYKNGKFFRRVKIRKSQRSASVVPNHSNNHGSNNNQYYVNRDNMQPINQYPNHTHNFFDNDPHSSLNRHYQRKDYQKHSNPNPTYNTHYKNSDQNSKDPFPDHRNHHHNRSNNFNNNDPYIINRRDYLYSDENEKDDYRGSNGQKRSSSVNRIRVKKKDYYSSHMNNKHNHSNSNHKDHESDFNKKHRRSSSAPRRSPFPLYINENNREKDNDSSINVFYVESSDSGKENNFTKTSSPHLERSKNISREITPFLLRKEKETQTPKGNQNVTKNNSNLFNMSSCEINQSKSVFLDLSQIEKKDEKRNKGMHNLSQSFDKIQQNSSSETEITSDKANKSYENINNNNINSSSETRIKNSIYKQLSELSENSYSSQSESKSKKRKRRTRSRASSRSSISISMATPSPSASEIDTSEFEIIQTPLKEFVKNKNSYVSEISSEFQEEEEEINDENSYSHLGERIKQIGTNSEIDNNQLAKKLNKQTKNYSDFTKIKAKRHSIKNHNKTNFIKMEKTNINKMFDVSSSSDGDDDPNNFANENKGSESEIVAQISSNSSLFTLNHQNERSSKRINNNSNEFNFSNSFSEDENIILNSIKPMNCEHKSSNDNDILNQIPEERYRFKILQLKKLPKYNGQISCSIIVNENKSFTTTIGKSPSFENEQIEFYAFPNSTISFSVIEKHKNNLNHQNSIASLQIALNQLPLGIEKWYKLQPSGLIRGILTIDSNDISTTVTPSNSDYSSSIYSSNIITRKI